MRVREVDHPTTGDTRAKDVVDAMVDTTWNLIGQDAEEIFNRLASGLVPERAQPLGR